MLSPPNMGLPFGAVPIHSTLPSTMRPIWSLCPMNNVLPVGKMAARPVSSFSRCRLKLRVGGFTGSAAAAEADVIGEDDGAAVGGAPSGAARSSPREHATETRAKANTSGVGGRVGCHGRCGLEKAAYRIASTAG
jgi:hypothetical protein